MSLPKLHTKEFSIKADDVTSDENYGYIKGYGAYFDNVDKACDRIHKGAFSGSIKEKGSFPLLWQHKWDQVIGKFTASEDKKGLVLDGKITLKTQQGRDTYELLKERLVDGLSIGYGVKEYSFTKEEHMTVMELKELDLYEVSVVTFPCNDKARVSDVKSEPVEFKSDEDILRYLSEKGLGISDSLEIVRSCKAFFAPKKEGLTYDAFSGLADILKNLK